MPENAGSLANRLADEGKKTMDFFHQIPEENWVDSIYHEGANWKLKEILAHFVATESDLRKLIQNILKADPKPPMNFDLDNHNESRVLQLGPLPVQELYDRFDQERKKTVAMVETLNPDDLAKIGWHPFLKQASIQEIIKMMYRHHMIHIREIRKTLSETHPDSIPS